MMTPEEQVEFVADGLNETRRGNFRAGAAAVSAWECTHPVPFDDYLDFLDGLQAVFGPFPIGERLSRGDDYRL